MSRRLPLVLAGVLVSATGVAAAVAVASAVSSSADRVPPRTAAASVAAPAVGTRALRVLHGWDERRAAAWSGGSPRRLVTLYAAGSEAGAADRAMLAAYRQRGLRVVGMSRQVVDVAVLASSPRQITLRVTDRLARAAAVGEGLRQRLPSSGYSTRTLTFRRTGRGWVLAG